MTERSGSDDGTSSARSTAVASPLSRFQSGSFTGIGSLPHRDAAAAAAFSLREHAIPVVPSLPKRSPAESLVAQAVTGLAGVTLGQYGSIAVDANRLDPDASVVTDLQSDAFVGFRTFLDCAAATGHTGPVKWQFVGPLTLGAALERAGAPAEIAYELARRAIRSHLRVLAHAIAEQLPDSPQLMLLDEPLLAGLMARDFPIAPDDAVDLVSGTMAALCPDVAVGVHCCAPADWASILATGPQVLSMPATAGLVSVAGYLDRFLRNGGWIAWGAVATEGPIGVTASRAWAQLSTLWCDLVRRGIDPVMLREQSLITPHCGLAPHTPAVAERICRTVGDVSKRVREQATAARFVLGA